MTLARLLVMIALALGLAAPAAQAELKLANVGKTVTGDHRIALVIGNGRYEAIGALDNTVSDAELMARTLTGVGFEVTNLIDADQNAMKRGIANFGRALREAGPDTVALFYYAGHAVQSFGTNYLLPVDSAIRDQADLDLVGVEAGWILRQLYSARVRTNIVILDSCRNNPFPNVAGFRDQGLAEMNAPTGSFIAYATAPGSVALDGLSGNSPYTSALARAIASDRESIELLFKKVRVQVLETTGGAQTPWESSSLTSDFYFQSEGKGGSAPAAAAPSNAEETLWTSVKDSGDATQVQLYLWTFPQGRHRGEAESLLAALTRPKPEAPQPDPAQDGVVAVTFTAPVEKGEPQIVGRSIQELIKSQPLFPPFEGIPDELWKGQHCTNCHDWTKERICEQAKFYVTEQAERSLDKPHPLGVEFKQHLRSWAMGGCR
ncbi:caspase family protein [Albidovulum sediminicola]|uniref:Caspase family protein n=1 Tax=Albidovulum sediminicola TaxID=2984331 RepID=A0ABT2YXK8_9RHOB|nr:caspase family protein [Defluviimonas sp. WL0075]MCV2863612.1 caspase family protein [Defluviimonas sp. WL0075]